MRIGCDITLFDAPIKPIKNIISLDIKIKDKVYVLLGLTIVRKLGKVRLRVFNKTFIFKIKKG